MPHWIFIPSANNISFDTVWNPESIASPNSLSVGSTTYPFLGSGNYWIPLVALDATSGEAVWVSGIGFTSSPVGSGGVLGSVLLSSDYEENSYIIFNIVPNSSATPVSLAAYNSAGVATLTAQTVNNALGSQAREVFLAKFSPSGDPLFFKRVLNIGASDLGDLTPAGDSNLRSLDARGPYIYMQIRGGIDSGATPGDTIEMIFGAGDPNELTYNKKRNQNGAFAMRFDKDTGEFNDVNVAGSTGNNTPGLSTTARNTGGGRWYEPSTDRYGFPLFTTEPAVNGDVVDFLGAQTPLVNIGANNRKAVFVVLDGYLDADQNESAASDANIASSFAYRTLPLADGGMLNLGSLAGPSGGSFSEQNGGSSVSNASAQDDQPFIVRHNSSDNIEWVKRLTYTGSRPFVVDAIADSVNDRFYIAGYTIGTQTITFGPGESGAITYDFVDNTFQHMFVLALNYTTGDLEWVQPVRQLTLSSIDLYPLLYEDLDGYLSLRFTAQDDVLFDPLGTPTTESFGTLSPSTGQVARARYTKDGVYAGVSKFFTYTLAGGPGPANAWSNFSAF